MADFEPELGQMLFGQLGQQYSATTECEILIDTLRYAFEATMRSVGEKIGPFDGPFSNSGAAFRCKEFGVWAYQWGDDYQPCNFYHTRTGLAISWYKYPGRSMSSNRKVMERLADQVLLSCLDALHDIRIGLMDYQLGGLGEVPYPDQLLKGVARG